ncbi:hypothetical protein MMC28_007670 [Mycoblastus sanguinarius]|nr:hypothetical protein [Mycoblastus sanguinarius]
MLASRTFFKHHTHPLASATHSTHAKKDEVPTAPTPVPRRFSVEPVTTATLPAYRRLITLLLPIHYPDQFYKDSVSDPTPSSLALCATWHRFPEELAGQKHEPPDGSRSSSPSQFADRVPVVGGIQCRLEPISSTLSAPKTQQLYIQTIGVLAPYRQLGIAAALLDNMIFTAVTEYEYVTDIYAHVWEANTDALEWYEKNGFVIEKETVEGYYRKLRPGGARIVRKKIGVGDHLKAGDRMENGEAEVDASEVGKDEEVRREAKEAIH